VNRLVQSILFQSRAGFSREDDFPPSLLGAADGWVCATKTALFKLIVCSVSLTGSPHPPLANCNDARYTLFRLESSKIRLNLAISDGLNL
jgi:hypothetical protein